MTIAGWPPSVDRLLVAAMRASQSRLGGDVRTLFARAELHGIADVLFERWANETSGLDRDLHEKLSVRRQARELEHDAYLAMVSRIDDVLSRAGITAVALKGAFLAERVYPRPASRGATDIDLLVRETDADVVMRAVEEIGYARSGDPRDARARREHHHVVLVHEHAPPLEIHFHAIRAFGAVLRSEPLIERSIPYEGANAIRVLASGDELLYLALHAAWHRFGRLGWLHDLALLIRKMTDDELGEARERAGALGFSRVLAFTAFLLSEVSDVPPARLSLLGRLGKIRTTIVSRVTAEPEHSLLRSATRFIYGVALCDSAPSALRYAASASNGYSRRVLRAFGT